MVAAVSGTAKTTPRPAHPRRLPLLSSEKDNGAAAAAGGEPARRPRARELTSRYLSYVSSPASTSSSSSSSSVSSASGPRRCPSPLVARASPDLPAQKRVQSAERRRHSVSGTAGDCPTAKALWASAGTTTRSLSVSFQGESFSLPVKKLAPCPSPAADRRRASPARGKDGESSRLLLEQHHRWPAKARSSSILLTPSLDHFVAEKIGALANGTLVSPIRASMDCAAEVSTSDTESVSSGSNSGISDSTTGGGNGIVGRPASRVFAVPARFWQETNSRLRRLHDSLPSPKKGGGSVKKPHPDSQRGQSSPLRAACRAASPSRLSASSPMGAQQSPSRSRPTPASVAGGGNVPSLINFAAEVRRGKMGEVRVEQAHALRLLHNRHLQWRFANARVNAALSIQCQTAERHLYTSWLATSELRDLVAMKRIQLQSQRLNLKLTSILMGQMSYLENWALIESDNSSSLTRVIRDLRASTLQLPVTEGAQADIFKVKDAMSSAVDVMQAMWSSISYLLAKVEEASLRANLLQLRPAPYLTQL